MLCRVCGEQKPEGGFPPSLWRKAITRSRCSDCISTYQKKRYQEGIKVTASEKRLQRLAVVNAIKTARGCMECGETHPACLDFHHRDPMQKEKGVGTLVTETTSIDRILEEIAKCDVICSNCHRKLHYGQKRPRKPKADPKILPIIQIA